MKIETPFKWSRAARAFTLLEVMIAAGIFFMAIFAILALVSTNLRNASLLQQPQVDGGMVIADLSLTNRFIEGTECDNFGDAYPGYSWCRDIRQVGTNGFFEVDCTVSHKDAGPNTDRTVKAYFYRPDSPAGAGF